MPWAAQSGVFDFDGSNVTFKGEPIRYTDSNGQEHDGLSFGLALSSGTFAGGEISAKIKFSKLSGLGGCEIVFFFDPTQKIFLSAGLGGAPQMYVIRQCNLKNPANDSLLGLAGNRRNLKEEHEYLISIKVRGSRVSVCDNNIEVLSIILPFMVPPSQIGLYCFDSHEIKIDEFKSQGKIGMVFVAMQFSDPYNDIFNEIISRICRDTFHLHARRADDVSGPGIVMADIINDIVESEFVIAEITPANVNVYYELGFAHAVGKQVILLANRKDLPQLPFDIAGARVLFYDNSIAGRGKFEDQLTQYIRAIIEKRSLPITRTTY